MPKHKIKDPELDHIMNKIRKLEEKLRIQERDRDSRSRSRIPRSYTPPVPPRLPEPPSPSSAPPAPPTPRPPELMAPPPAPELLPLPTPTPAASLPVQTTTATVVSTATTENTEESLPEEFLLALGHEGEEKVETGEPINNELATRWTKIMTGGLTKDQKEALLGKYKIPENFSMAVAPILNKEIAATLSDISINRDKRIINRQNLTGKLMGCLGRSLTDILKGNINSKKLIEEINDAAKIAAEIYCNDIKSRKFFALSNATKTVQDSCKDTKAGKYLFGDGLAEQLKSIQAVKRTATQIKIPENKTSTTTAKPPVNWRGPPQVTNHRGRGGHRPIRHTVTQQPRRAAPIRGAPKHTLRRINQRRN